MVRFQPRGTDALKENAEHTCQVLEIGVLAMAVGATQIYEQ